MAKKVKRGATRVPPPTMREPIPWGKFLRHISIIVLISIFGVSFYYLIKKDTLPILHVTVEGDFEHVDRNLFIKQVTPYATGNFISIDVDMLQAAAESLPWVKQAQVSRIWPDSLHFIVKEHSAVAKWGNDGLLSQDGNLFFPAENTIPASLPILLGAKKHYKMIAKRYHLMRQALAKEELTIRSLSFDERRAWIIVLNNGITVHLGRENSEQRFKRFLMVYRTRLKPYQSKIISMDMRYTNGLSVQWKDNKQPDLTGTV